MNRRATPTPSSGCSDTLSSNKLDEVRCRAQFASDLLMRMSCSVKENSANAAKISVNAVVARQLEYGELR